jgi:hypothetical protein
MHVFQHQIINNEWIEIDQPTQSELDNSTLVLAFGSYDMVRRPETRTSIKSRYKNADIVLASTAGEILGNGVFDDSVVINAISFDKTKTKCICTNIKEHKNSFDSGAFIMESLNADNLQAIIIISDGTFINGSELVSGINSKNTKQIPVTGGLAGDGARFQHTATGLNEIPGEGNLIGIGFYGQHLQIGHGSFGGWDEFGPQKLITRSQQNVLFEIDGKSALDLYKEYLGDYANELPSSALLFPISINLPGSENNIVRTILAIDNENKSMTFAGNMPEGSKVILMKANFDKLIDASAMAAQQTYTPLNMSKPSLALLISCVGRKLVLQERTEEEVDAAQSIFGSQTKITGFYSYGEISPFNSNTSCELHNQTMTITTFAEI